MKLIKNSLMRRIFIKCQRRKTTLSFAGNQVLVPPKNALVSVGKKTYGYEHLQIHSWDDSTMIYIGNYCALADNIHIYLGGNHKLDTVSTFPFKVPNTKKPEMPLSKGDIKIGNDVWIGSHVSIMSGIKIGDGAVIAAHSHVVKDIKPYEIVGGNPARQIRMRFDSDIVRELLRIKWWNWSDSKVEANIGWITQNPQLQKLKEIKN